VSARSVRKVATTLAGLVALSCSKPEPPKVEPHSVQVKTLALTGIQIRSELDVTNPNSFPLVVRSVDGKLLVGSGIEVGNGRLLSGANIPAKGTVRVVGDMSLPWSNFAAFAPLAASGKPVPYTFDGTANIGGEKLNIDVPFKIKGEITREQMLAAGLRGFQGLPQIPGVP